MRKSQRPQSPSVHQRAHRYRVDHEATAERERLERALEIGLEDTFPASDPVAVVQPGSAPDVDEHGPERAVLDGPHAQTMWVVLPAEQRLGTSNREQV